MNEHFEKERFKNRPLDHEIKAIVEGLLGDDYADGGNRFAGFTHAFGLSYLTEIYNDTNAYIDVNIHLENLEQDDPKEVFGYVRGLVDAIHPGALYNVKEISIEKVSITFDWAWNEKE